LLLAASLAGCQEKASPPATQPQDRAAAQQAPDQARQLGRREFEFPREIAGRPKGSSWLIRVDLSAADPASPSLPLRGRATFVGRGGRTASLSLSVSPPKQTLTLMEGVVGFAPERLVVEGSSGLLVSDIRFEPSGLAPRQDDRGPTPVPADPGTVLLYRQEYWRNPGYELFAWNLFPKILILDFADYAVQAKFFRRLGFYQAVKGESGRVEEEEYYKGRHVYNAHAYGPEDLASFFELAREKGVRLNQEEELLKNIALKSGLLVVRDGRLRPGEGAVTSVARETPTAHLRRQLLTHEVAHGLFFAIPEFREGCFRTWADLAPGELEFFKLFLGNKGRLDRRPGYDGYDTENKTVTVNEFQAHVLQLERQEATGYGDWYMGQMIWLIPDRRKQLEAFRRENPAVFGHARDRLVELLFRTTGLYDGNIYVVSDER